MDKFLETYNLSSLNRHITSNKNRISNNKISQRGDQNGKVGGCWCHLPPWTHKKYIYVWTNSDWKQTGDWQTLLNQGYKERYT